MVLTKFFSALIGASLILSGCAANQYHLDASPTAPSATTEKTVTPAFTGIKHRIGIAKFEDRSGYGTNLFGVVEDVGVQASEILTNDLVATGAFTVIEQRNLKTLVDEKAAMQAGLIADPGQIADKPFLGVTAFIFGTITELGTKTAWNDAGLSKTKVEIAHAKVSIRMVDPQTGVAFFSENGEADVKNQSTQTLGFGGRIGYDGSLTDQAISRAISTLTAKMVAGLQSRPWKTNVLEVQDSILYIGAGKSTGLRVGDNLVVMNPGRRILNSETGSTFQLPGTLVASAKVISQFGAGAADEGSICSISSKTQEVQKDFEVLLSNP
jgi:curli biogenesis system outer membrane secretion channel CsgG